MNKIFMGESFIRFGVESSRPHGCYLFRSPKGLRSNRCKYARNGRQNATVLASSPPGVSHLIHHTVRKDCKHKGWISCTKPMQGISSQSVHPRAPSCRLDALPLNMAAIVAWGQALPAQFGAVISRGILMASVKASIKLGLICLAVGWLLKKQLLPEDTAPVLSKVAFNLCIPCMLFTKIAETLAVTQNVMLLWIPLAAGIQVGAGYAIGVVAAKLLENGAFFLPIDPNRNLVTPTRAAPAIAASTASAFGNPMAAPALIPKPSSPPRGLSQLVTASCMFGNSLTLPLIFLLTLLPPAMAGPAPAYVAMFLIGWSPLFWSWGFSILGNTEDSNQGKIKGMPRYTGPLMSDLKKSIPVGFHESSTSASASGDFQAGDSIAINPPSVADRFLAFLSVMQDKAIQLAKHVLTLPFTAILAGCVIGLSPLGKAVFTPDGAREIALWTSTETGARIVQSVVFAMKSVTEVMVLFGEATLPLGAIILASSLFAKDNSKEEKDGAAGSQSLVRILIPENVFERRALLLVSLARFVAMPIVGLASVFALSTLGALPSDPACHFGILLQATMPPAQNLTVMMNLREETRKTVPATAKFLMRMYVLSLIGPVMIWTTIFAMFTGVQLG
ncbi:hypothetical protein BSKO_03123 [Bryopsis sp. KO-2023]|nr:hypothetical protein BSKO_03123 [Bryopsis sp. KO-2023]